MGVRTARVSVNVADAGVTSTGALLSAPVSGGGDPGLHAEIVAVRLVYKTPAVHTLATVRVHLFMIDENTPSGRTHLLYDSGTQTHGVDGVVLTESDDDPVWNDHLGALRSVFNVRNASTLHYRLNATVSAGAGTSPLVLEVDYKDVS